MQKLIISLICCLLPTLALADELTIRPDAPDRYTVVKGDTLWDISGKFFKDPWKWPQIWGLNKEAIKNPHWIYPGDVIVLDRLHKMLQVTPGVTGPATAESGVPPAAPPTQPETPQQRQLFGERLTPHIIVGPGEHDAIPSIPFADIRPFLNQALVLEEGEINDTPEIVAGLERSLLADGDTAYARALPTNKGTEWQVYRSGNALVDPESGDTLGYEAIYLGNARVEKFGKISTLQIYGARQEIHPGDHLIQAPEEFPENFIPRAPDDDISGRVIKIVNGISMAGTGSIIILNKGRRDGLQNGHVLALYRKGATVQRGNYGLSHDTQLPDVRYGLVFVFRTFEKVSYALVMDSKLPVHLLDLAETP